MPTRETFKAKLVAAKQLTPRIKELEFERLDGKPSDHRPGQWVEMVLPPRDKDGHIDRQYSYSSLADGGPRFRVMVTRLEDGVGSQWLHEAPVGTELVMDGPGGTFVREGKHERAPALLVASGSGFGPVCTMVEQALRDGRTEPLVLLLGAKTLADVPFPEDLERWRAASNVRVELTLSEPGAGWTGRSGFVQDHLAEVWRQFHEAHPDAVVFACGWRRMVAPVKDVLRGLLDVPPANIHFQAFD